MTGSPTTVVAGSSHNYTVTAQDGFGNTATGYTGTVALHVDSGGSTLPGTHAFVGGDNGVFLFTGVALDLVVPADLTATDTVTSSITGDLALTVTPAAATILVVTGSPTTVVAGSSHNYTVTAQDGFGNTATGYTGTVALHVDSGRLHPARDPRLRQWR